MIINYMSINNFKPLELISIEGFFCFLLANEILHIVLQSKELYHMMSNIAVNVKSAEDLRNGRKKLRQSIFQRFILIADYHIR